MADDEHTTAVQQTTGQRHVGDEPSPAELLGDIAHRKVVDVWRDVQKLGLDPRIVNAR